MLKTPKLAMPRSSKVTIVYNGKREVWTDYEEAKAYFLELMISTDGLFTFSSFTGWRNVRTRTNIKKTGRCC